jgi:hypothetical protein
VSAEQILRRGPKRFGVAHSTEENFMNPDTTERFMRNRSFYGFFLGATVVFGTLSGALYSYGARTASAVFALLALAASIAWLWSRGGEIARIENDRLHISTGPFNRRSYLKSEIRSVEIEAQNAVVIKDLSGQKFKIPLVALAESERDRFCRAVLAFAPRSRR